MSLVHVQGKDTVQSVVTLKAHRAAVILHTNQSTLDALIAQSQQSFARVQEVPASPFVGSLLCTYKEGLAIHS